MLICSLFLAEVQVPLPGYTKTRGFFKQKLRIFKLFPVSSLKVNQTIFSSLAYHCDRVLCNLVCGKSYRTEYSAITSYFSTFLGIFKSKEVSHFCVDR